MTGVQLNDLGDELLERARIARSGRAAHTILGGAEHLLQQTMVALISGEQLSEHNNPGEATLQVLRGEVSLSSPSGSWSATVGELVVIPNERHSLSRCGMRWSS